MVDDREGTLRISAGFVWDLTGGEDLDFVGFVGFGGTVTGSHFPEAVDCDRFGDHRLNFLFGRGTSLGSGLVGLVGLWDGEDVDLEWPWKSDAKVGRGDELGAVEGRDDDLDNCGGAMGGAIGGADKGTDIPALWGS